MVPRGGIEPPTP